MSDVYAVFMFLTGGLLLALWERIYYASGRFTITALGVWFATLYYGSSLGNTLCAAAFGVGCVSTVIEWVLTLRRESRQTKTEPTGSTMKERQI